MGMTVQEAYEASKAAHPERYAMLAKPGIATDAKRVALNKLIDYVMKDPKVNFKKVFDRMDSIFPKALLGAMQVFSRLALLIYRGTPRLVIHAGDMKAMGEENLLSLVKFASKHREKIMYQDL